MSAANLRRRSSPGSHEGVGASGRNCVYYRFRACGQLAAQTSQTITFDTVPNQIFGVSPFAIAAQASSLLPVSFTSTTPAVCKNAGDMVTLLSAGTCSITASQAGNGSFSPAPSVMQSFTVNPAKPSGTLTASAAGPFAVGSDPQSIVAGDFNGDGIPDIAVSNFNDSTVTVLLGNGSGGFTAATNSPFVVGSSPYFIVAGDFNGDGVLDLATVNGNSNNVTVLLGNGSGGFAAATGSPFAVGSFPVSLALGDFNGDGIQDLAVSNFTDSTVTVLLGNGAGGFAAAAGSPFTTGTNPAGIVVDDFNGDGKQDLAVANYTSSNVTVLLGNGSGGFTAATNSPFAVGTNPPSLVVDDFNGDGVPDLAVANFTDSTVTVLLGDGLGGFVAPTGSPFAVGSDPFSIVAGDFNGDGIPDLATANDGSNNVTVLIGNGTGGFAAATGNAFVVGSAPDSVVAGDFNGDGLMDLAVANSGANSNNVTVLLGGLAATSSVLTTTATAIIGLGQSVPLNLAVSDTATAFNAPTGSATFSDGATVLGTATQTSSPYTFMAANLGLGSHTLTASYGGDTRNGVSTSNSIVIQVETAQTITFAPLNNVIYGVAPFTVTATASSGLTVTLTSTTTAVCTVSVNTVTIVTGGTCSITASQAGDSTYASCPVGNTEFQRYECSADYYVRRNSECHPGNLALRDGGAGKFPFGG